MAGMELAVVLGILFLFGSIIALMVRSERQDRETKLQISRSLGFTPMDATPELVRTMTQLYHNIRVNQSHPSKGTYELENVSRKMVTDGEMLIFDLIDTSGGDNSYIEKQAVAILSPHLNLPAFVIFPKADMDGAVPQAGQVLNWVISKLGNSVEFPQFPELEQRYLISSPDPDGTRRFLDDSRLRRLAKTRLMEIHAGGNIFTVSHMGMFTDPLTQEIIGERVNQAIEIFSIFLS